MKILDRVWEVFSKTECANNTILWRATVSLLLFLVISCGSAFVTYGWVNMNRNALAIEETIPNKYVSKEQCRSGREALKKELRHELEEIKNLQGKMLDILLKHDKGE